MIQYARRVITMKMFSISVIILKSHIKVNNIKENVLFVVSLLIVQNTVKTECNDKTQE